LHELSIAEEIRDEVLAQAKKHGAKKVTKIKLIIGEATSIVADALIFAFESAGSGTIMQKAKILIKSEKVMARCKGCSKKFAVKELNYICPKCKGTSIEITSGKEMIIQSIEME
jgi:hydrogenase nickel incorporation protein HypA/HybF